jgi:REP element-mobilizing transposase RayT
MVKPLILVTPRLDFGELIRQSLIETRKFQVTLHSSIEQTLSEANDKYYFPNHFKYAILDIELGQKEVLKLGLALRQLYPNINLIIISKNIPSPDFYELLPWKLLQKPFLRRDLLISLDETSLPEDAQPIIIDVEPEYTERYKGGNWLGEPGILSGRLAELINTSPTQEVMLFRDNLLWAHAGQFAQESVVELENILRRNWNPEREGDLFRYIRLESNRTDHTLYASLILVGVILALVFDPKTPFSTIRYQTNYLTETLLLPAPKDEPPSLLLKPANVGLSLPENTAGISQPGLSEVLSYQFTYRTTQKHLREDEPSKAFVEAPPPINKSPQTDLIRPRLSKSRPLGGSKAISEELSALQPGSPSFYYLTYTCLLLPRFTSDRLEGEIADLLRNYLPIICTSYGWRLEFMDTNPGYLIWAANVPPTIAPSYQIQIIRKETSKRIFEDFEWHKRDNLSEDFWAPGFLIMGGMQPFSEELAMAFINQNRQRFGHLLGEGGN